MVFSKSSSRGRPGYNSRKVLINSSNLRGKRNEISLGEKEISPHSGKNQGFKQRAFAV